MINHFVKNDFIEKFCLNTIKGNYIDHNFMITQ